MLPANSLFQLTVQHPNWWQHCILLAFLYKMKFITIKQRCSEAKIPISASCKSYHTTWRFTVIGNWGSHKYELFHTRQQQQQQQQQQQEGIRQHIGLNMFELYRILKKWIEQVFKEIIYNICMYIYIYMYNCTSVYIYILYNHMICASIFMQFLTVHTFWGCYPFGNQPCYCQILSYNYLQWRVFHGQARLPRSNPQCCSLI